MSQNLGELLNKLVSQAGLDTESEGVKALLSNPTVSGYEIDPSIANGITSNLMTVESAKNNPTLKNHFYALALNGVDSEINNLVGSMELEQSIVEELNAEKSSTKRVGLLINKIKELESAKVNANNSGKEKLNEQIEGLNAQINSLKEAHANEMTAQATAHRENIKDLQVNTLLSAYDYALPTDKDVSILTAKQVINGELSKHGAKVVLNDNNELALQTNEGTDFYLNNEKVTFKGLAESTLANHKLLKTVEKPTPNSAPTGGGQTPPSNPASNEFLAAASQNLEQLSE